MRQIAIEQYLDQRMQNSGATLVGLNPVRSGFNVHLGDAPLPVSKLIFETRLAKSTGEIAIAQSLRYEVFYREMSAKGDPLTQLTGRDQDKFDKICDHLLVFDHELYPSSKVIATYRLLRRDIAERHDGFYSASEFDLAPILAAHSNLNFLELGRSCVKSAYRTKRTIELLWQGSWSYVKQHNIDVMIGCASLQGTNPAELALQLSFLKHYARAPEGWRVNAVLGRGSAMDQFAKSDIDVKRALRSIPPLIRAYILLGAWVGEEAVVDHQFGTTDVLIILPIVNIKQRYVDYYDAKIAR